MLRLVLDARWTNRMCRQPPHSRLAVPAALARLLASRDAAALEEAELTRLIGGPPSWTADEGDDAAAADEADDALYGFSVDLADGFYQFRCAAMASYFGL
eukprot:11181139-Lingulodinium_polyedra.AAC.1